MLLALLVVVVMAAMGDAQTNGAWSVWGAWVPCAVSCGGANHTRTRTRTCTNPAYTANGTTCQGDADEEKPCGNQPCPTGNTTLDPWSQWGVWTECTQTCGGGLRVRYRSCVNPPTGGAIVHCVGNNQHVEECNTNVCGAPGDGSWSLWSTWNACTKKCGGGIRLRIRDCNRPPPSPNGKDCVGENLQSDTCNNQTCPTVVINGNWSDWIPSSKCTALCDGGIQLRERSCTSPAPGPYGDDCVGQTQEYHECNIHRCDAPAHGNWSLWSAWDTCTESCGGGLTLRTRKCDNPAPQLGGDPCVGQDLESSECNPDACPTVPVIHGMWMQWSSWTKCTATCSGGLQIRKRSCPMPTLPTSGPPVEECIGVPQQTQECNKQECARPGTIYSCPAGVTDGGWSRWMPWYKCTVTCGGGVQMRDRKCDNPKPDPKGRDCVGDPHQTSLCNRHTCPTEIHGNWSTWTAWTKCTAECGGGIRLRERACDNPAPAQHGRYCDGQHHETDVCNTKMCPPLGKDFVSFCVRLNINIDKGHGIVPFNYAVHNVGGHFHFAESSFFAPVKGVYSFSFTGATSQTPALDLRLRYQIDDDNTEYTELARSYSKSAWYRNGAASAIHPMEKHSRVYVYNYETSTAGQLTYFSGMLVQKL